MQEAFIQSVTIQGFGCVKDLTLAPLTPLHALIGPNDSGKSTVLRALRTAFAPDDVLNDEGRKLWANGRIILRGSGGLEYEVRAEGGTVTRSGDPAVTGSLPARLLKLDADALKRPSQLVPSDQDPTLGNDRGYGLAGVYDAIVNRDVTRFLAIRDELTQLFPSIRTLGFRNTASAYKELEFELVDGTRVPAAMMSEGLLYYLAFAALPHLSPTRLLLVEEPETGLHPARIQEIMRILREISHQTQVIVATHSPLVVNELSGAEVHVITRDLTLGTQARLLEDTPNFEQRSQVYALGELWLSYADGKTEAPLLEKDRLR